MQKEGCKNEFKRSGFGNKIGMHLTIVAGQTENDADMRFK